MTSLNCVKLLIITTALLCKIANIINDNSVKLLLVTVSIASVWNLYTKQIADDLNIADQLMMISYWLQQLEAQGLWRSA